MLRVLVTVILASVVCSSANAADAKSSLEQQNPLPIGDYIQKTLRSAPISSAASHSQKRRQVVPSDGVLIKRGFLAGNDYRQRDDSYRSAYLMGVIDGFLFSPIFGAPKNGPLGRIERCVTGMQNNQVMTLIDEFLLKHPVQWHEDMHSLTFQALRETCPQ